MVTASINQWGSLAKQIGGQDVTVRSILDSTSIKTHDFTLQNADTTKLTGAEIVVANGAGYDSWATGKLGKNAVTVSASTTVGATNGDNPHLWFSKDARSAMATELENAFAKARPSKARRFAARLKAWKTDEEKLEKTMAGFKKDHPDATYAATESVAYYLMDDLGFTDKTPQGYIQAMTTGAQPDRADMDNLRMLASSRTINVLVNDTQQANDMTNTITGAAGRSQLPVVDITEQMPSDQKTLGSWIAALIEQFQSAMTAFDNTEEGHRKVDGADASRNHSSDSTPDSGISDSEHQPTNSEHMPSNQGQTDPGK